MPTTEQKNNASDKQNYLPTNKKLYPQRWLIFMLQQNKACNWYDLNISIQMGSCVLKASAVECRTLDQASIHTGSVLNQNSNDTSVGTLLTVN